MARAAARQGVTGQPAGDTKARIVDAALETLKQEGIVGTSARAIGRIGGFNQALIFYHFGSVNDLLLAGVEKMVAERRARYEHRLAEVQNLPELVEVAAQLHAEDAEAGHVRVLAQMLAGAAASPELGEQLAERLEPQDRMVQDVIERVLRGTPYEGLVPAGDLAFAVSSLFLGIEMTTQFGGDPERTQRVFTTLRMLAMLLGQLIQLDGSTPEGAPPPSSTG